MAFHLWMTLGGGRKARMMRAWQPSCRRQQWPCRLGRAKWCGLRPQEDRSGDLLECPEEGAWDKAKVKVGDNEVPFNKEARWWLGVWLDSQLTLQEHHAT